MTAGRTVRIEETTVATIDGWKVTVSNVMLAADPAQSGHKRPTAQVGRYDAAKADQGEREVAAEAVLDIAGHKWRVAQVVLGVGGANGYVDLVEQR